MKLSDSFNLVPHILNITYITNTGASFGILKDHRWIFMILSTVALILMAAAVVYFARQKNHKILTIAIALMLGGGFGNMIDRFFRGEVVDFFEFAFVKFAIFNVADSFICIGSVLFCLCIFSGKYSLFGTTKSKDENNAEIIETTDEESAEYKSEDV
jgi:signal peptidase II